MEDNIFEKNSIVKTYLTLALPAVFNMLVSIIYNMVDTYFIAKTNDLNLVAGVSLCAPIFMILMALGNILGQGGSSLLSRLIGSNLKEDTKRVSAFCFYVALFIGIIVGILMLVFKEPILNILGASSNTYNYALDYYLIFTIGAPIVVLNFIHGNLLRCEGLAFNSMAGSVSGTVINMILDPIFIFTLNMGAKGAALATLIGYLFTVIYQFLVVIKKSKYISVSFKLININNKYISDIITVGIPAALTNITSSICTILINQYLLPYGDDKIAMMGIALKVINIGSLILVGFSFGGAPIIGYFYGAKNKTKLKELVRFCYSFEGILSIILGLILFIGAPYLLSLFLSDSSLLLETTRMFRLQVIGLPFMGFILISTIFCQSFGKANGSLILSLSRQGIVFILSIIILSNLLGYDGVIWSQFVSDSLSMLIALLIFKFIINKTINELN